MLNSFLDFILTKWYVNVSTFDMCCGVMFMFYINYVDSKLNRKKKHLLK
ncbi:hypothetical protein BN178_870003 [Clostridioides difficile T42]|nr:hypothetical protein BN178_870003 [Clostridioides difficile T42]